MTALAYAADLEPFDQPAGRPIIADTTLKYVDGYGWQVTLEYVDGTVSQHRANEMIDL